MQARGHMDPRCTVVVTDVSTSDRFAKCLRQVAGTVDKAVEIVGISHDFPALAPALARRVRKVQVRAGQTIADLVTTEAVRDRLIVVARPECRFSKGWLASLTVLMERASWGAAGVLGQDAFLIAFPASCRTKDATQFTLTDVAGVRLPSNSFDDVPVKISASMIMKDEEAAIEASVRALLPLVDEVVIYDTGSADRSIEIAEAAGAKVIRGYWDEHFANARNRALEHCVGDWIFVVDADEVVHSDREALRKFLSQRSWDLAQVVVTNTSWADAETGHDFRSIRLFRRGTCLWAGRLHEMLNSVHGGQSLRMAPAVAPARLMHSGYRADVFAAKDKAARNLDMATRAVQSPDASLADWAGYGRSLMAAGRQRDAFEALDTILDRYDSHGSSEPSDRQVILSAGRPVLDALDIHFNETRARRWLTAVEQCGESPGQVTLWRARFAMAQGDLSGARDLLVHLEGGVDIWGMPFDVALAEIALAQLNHLEGRSDEAARALLALADERPDRVPLAMLLTVWRSAGRVLADLARQIPSALYDRSLREVFRLAPDAADEWLDVLWEQSGDARVLVAASIVASKCSFERQLVWSLRARENGYTDACPLRLVAMSTEASPESRCLAAAVLVDVLGESDMQGVFDETWGQVASDSRGPLIDQLRMYVPSLPLQLAQ